MMWIVYALLSAGFAAAVAIFGKLGLKDVDTTVATTIRAVVMAVFLLIATGVLQKFALIKTVGNQALTFIIFSGVAGALSWLFYFLAIKHGPVTGVAALDRLSVVFVVILAAIFLGEALTAKSVTGLVFLVIGALLLVFK
ncbi:MAG: EamA family transporter [Parcubacteria group bacterium]